MIVPGVDGLRSFALLRMTNHSASSAENVRAIIRNSVRNMAKLVLAEGWGRA